MRLLPVSVTVGLLLVLAGCAGAGGDRVSPDDYEQVRDTAQQVGDDAIAAAAAAFGVRSGDGKAPVSARSCSGAPDGFVRVERTTTLVYPAGTPPDGVLRGVERAWADLGLEVETRNERLIGTTTAGAVDLSVTLRSAVTAKDGSDTELRYASIETSCFDVGADLAREITR